MGVGVGGQYFEEFLLINTVQYVYLYVILLAFENQCQTNFNISVAMK